MTRRRFSLGSPNLALMIVLVGLIAVASSPVAAHGGGLDKYGCHHDRKAGTYHCHRGPCAGKAFPSQGAMMADACSKAR